MAGQLHLYVGQCVGVGKQLHALPSHPTLCELQLRYAKNNNHRTLYEHDSIESQFKIRSIKARQMLSVALIGPLSCLQSKLYVGQVDFL